MTKILYVDDEPDIREIAVLSLQRDPSFDVRPCGSGREALEAVKEWRPDLVMLDVVMPDMDGPAILARLRGLLFAHPAWLVPLGLLAVVIALWLRRWAMEYSVRAAYNPPACPQAAPEAAQPTPADRSEQKDGIR